MYVNMQFKVEPWSQGRTELGVKEMRYVGLEVLIIHNSGIDYRGSCSQ